jgi:hypothetical protein
VKFTYVNWCDNSEAECRETIYKYEDTIVPIITSCPSADLDITTVCCTANVTLKPTATYNGGCSTIFTWSALVFLNNPNPAISATSTISGTGIGTTPSITINILPAGIHGVRYKVTDGCGNISECDA